MLSEFLDFNHNCPICGRELTLYMQWINSMLFKADKVEPNVYEFHPVPHDSTQPTEENMLADGMLMNNCGTSVETYFSSNKIQNEAKRYQIYFFYLCNPEGIKKKPGKRFEVNIYATCYYRSTPLFEFRRNDTVDGKDWSLEITHPDHKNLVNRSERFTISRHADGVEKAYFLTLNHVLKETVFWYYTVSDEEKKIEGFKPNILEKKMPLLGRRPDFNKLDKLVDRMDSWVIMS